MTQSITARQTKLEKAISQVAGVQVEITVIDKKNFSFLFDGDNKEAANKIVKYFSSHAIVDNDGYDEECDCTCIYVKVK
jgi:hypothetical protein